MSFDISKKTYIQKLQSLLLIPSEKVFTALVVRRIKNISECTKLQNIVSKQNFSSIFRRRVEVQLKDKIRFSQAEVTKRLPFRFGFSCFHSVQSYKIILQFPMHFSLSFFFFSRQTFVCCKFEKLCYIYRKASQGTKWGSTS